MIKVPQQTEAVAPNDTEEFLKLMTLGAPARLGDLMAQANRLDPEVRFAKEFSNFSWEREGLPVVHRHWKSVEDVFFEVYLTETGLS